MASARAPTTCESQTTYSAFSGTFQRLLQFKASETTPFYMRFSLFVGVSQRPMLVIGNEKSKAFFWDMQSLEEFNGTSPTILRVVDQGHGSPTSLNSKSRKRQKGVARRVSRPAFTAAGQKRESSTHSNLTATTRSNSNSDIQIIGTSTSLSSLKEKYSVNDPFMELLPHETVTIPRVDFALRQSAWSVGGEWLVMVGDEGMIVLFAKKRAREDNHDNGQKIING